MVKRDISKNIMIFEDMKSMMYWSEFAMQVSNLKAIENIIKSGKMDLRNNSIISYGYRISNKTRIIS